MAEIDMPSSLRGIWCGAALSNSTWARADVDTPARLSSPCAMHLSSGRIAGITGERPADMTGWLDVPELILAPGLFDIQVNGALGHSFQSTDAAHFETIADFHARRATTALLATLVTAPEPVLIESLRCLAAWIRDRRARDAFPTIPGIHLEGPFLSPERSGAHDPTALRTPDPDLADRLIEAAGGALKLVTLAPELPGALDLIRHFVARGVVVSIGHSAARYDEVRAAVDAGASMVTHVGNASDWPQRKPNEYGFSGSEPGVVGAFLAVPALRGSVVADGFHLHPALIGAIHTVKGDDGLILTSDASTVTGAPPGDYITGGLHARVDPRGFATSLRGNPSTGVPGLAGSIITLSDAVALAHSRCGIPIASALTMASTTPARALGMTSEITSLEAGAVANLVLLNSGGSLVSVIARGAVLS